MKRPNQLSENSYLYFFKDGIRPVWQDPHNKNGGSFVLRFEKDKCNRVWEEMLLSYIGSEKEVVENINGIRIKIRKDGAAEIDVWVSDVYNEEQLEKQSNWVLEACSLKGDTILEIISFDQ